MILGLGAVSYADISNKSLTEDSPTTLSGDVVKPSQNVTIIFSSTASEYTAGSWHSKVVKSMQQLMRKTYKNKLVVLILVEKMQ